MKRDVRRRKELWEVAAGDFDLRPTTGEVVLKT